MNESDLVTFGKHKGKPIEVLASDRSYVEWLLAQDWFAGRQPREYTFIINNFQAPEDTPEHNQLQALFLDDNFCVRFSRLLSPRHFDDVFHETIFGPRFYANEKSKINHEIRGETIGRIHVGDRRFEHNGIDVSFRIDVEFLTCFTKKGYEDEWTRLEESSWRRSEDYKIEIKPSVGDDYPNVLRQMKSLHCNVLLVGRFTGTGVNCSQFVQFFENEGLRVVFLDELQPGNQLSD